MPFWNIGLVLLRIISLGTSAKFSDTHSSHTQKLFPIPPIIHMQSCRKAMERNWVKSSYKSKQWCTSLITISYPLRAFNLSSKHAKRFRLHRLLDGGVGWGGIILFSLDQTEPPLRGRKLFSWLTRGMKSQVCATFDGVCVVQIIKCGS